MNLAFDTSYTHSSGGLAWLHRKLLIHMHIITFIITSALLTEGCCPAIFKHKDGTKAGGQGQDPP